MPKKPTGGSAPKRQVAPKPGPGAKNKALGRPSSTSASAPAPKMKKKGTGAARRYLVKSSGTTKGELRGVMNQLRSGKISKGAAIKALKGGPKRGVPAGNKKRVAKAIRKVR